MIKAAAPGASVGNPLISILQCILRLVFSRLFDHFCLESWQDLTRGLGLSDFLSSLDGSANTVSLDGDSYLDAGVRYDFVATLE